MGPHLEGKELLSRATTQRGSQMIFTIHHRKASGFREIASMGEKSVAASQRKKDIPGLPEFRCDNFGRFAE
jgi:hypothetical protein